MPFFVEILPGRPAYEQVVHAVHRAVATGLMVEGDAFPSVRALSKAVRINPNTAHKVVAQLVGDGTLVVMPGRGTRIGVQVERPLERRVEMVRPALEDLVVEARRLGFTAEEFRDVVGDVWEGLGGE